MSHSVEETIEIGRRFAGTIEPGVVVCLYGELGSGKTVFVKGVCSGLDVMEEVTIPSFVIATEYQGRFPVSHIDLYRLDKSGVRDLHLTDYITQEGVTLIEWAERLPRVIQASYTVTFAIHGMQTREIVIEDPRY